MTRRRFAAGSAALLVMLAAGCAPRDRAALPTTVLGQTCASCGMEVRESRYMAAIVAQGRVRPFDSIECAMKDAGEAAPRGDRVVYLADYATGRFHRADSLWILRAKIPSPMGAGLAAFLDRAEAERIAAAREGTVSPGTALLHGAGGAR